MNADDEKAFAEALSRPGARLLLHPDDLRLINRRGAGSIPALPAAAMAGVEIVTSEWVERGRLVVLARRVAGTPCDVPTLGHKP